jgi:hypothetical protein
MTVKSVYGKINNGGCMNFYGPAVKTEELAVVVSKPSDKYFAGCTASTEYT